MTLTAAPAVGSEITAWSGACSGSDTSAQVSVDQAKTCHVDFAVQVFQLTTSVTGSGSVASAPLGISCGADCSESYDYGTSVTLTANARNRLGLCRLVRRLLGNRDHRLGGP